MVVFNDAVCHTKLIALRLTKTLLSKCTQRFMQRYFHNDCKFCLFRLDSFLDLKNFTIYFERKLCLSIREENDKIESFLSSKASSFALNFEKIAFAYLSIS